MRRSAGASCRTAAAAPAGGRRPTPPRRAGPPLAAPPRTAWRLSPPCRTPGRPRGPRGPPPRPRRRERPGAAALRGKDRTSFDVTETTQFLDDLAVESARLRACLRPASIAV